MTVRVALPDDQLCELVGPSTEEIEFLVWDWRSAVPAPSGVTVLVSAFSPVPPGPRTWAQLPRLRMVQVPSSGVEPWTAALPPGVALCSGRGIHGASAAEAAVAGVLALLRGLPAAVRAQRAQDWRPMVVDQLAGRRAVIVGAGDVGGRIATAFAALGAVVTLMGRRPRAGVRGIDDLARLLPDTDVLVLAVPLTDRTRHLVDAAAMAALPDGAVIANVARGPVLDTAALLAERGRVCAYLDVTDPEPLPPGHPLWDQPGVLVTPHTGGGETQWRTRFGALVRAQGQRMARGDPPLNLVAPVVCET